MMVLIPICNASNQVLPIFRIFRRNLKNGLIAKRKAEKSAPKALALQYFDFFYGSSFGKEWPGMRLALLTGHKHAALINNYADNSAQTIQKLEQLTAIDMIEFSKMYVNKTHESMNQSKGANDSLDNKRNQQDQELNIPASFKAFCFDNGNYDKFPEPDRSESRLLNYYCLDASSLLPVIAMDIQKNDKILDLCASPGGKTLAMAQTLRPSLITCRDVGMQRMDRMKKMLRSYLNKNDLNNMIVFQDNETKEINNNVSFDKVLVDVPCTNDRKSLFQDENNIFAKNRNDERVSIQKKQATLLKQAIESCHLNGTVVYSTCTLSPIQNEGVVNSVLESFMDNSSINFKLEVAPLDHIKENLNYFFSFSTTCKLGLLVIPDIQRNFGPFFLCKILKLPK